MVDGVSKQSLGRDVRKKCNNNNNVQRGWTL